MSNLCFEIFSSYISLKQDYKETDDEKNFKAQIRHEISSIMRDINSIDKIISDIDTAKRRKSIIPIKIDLAKVNTILPVIGEKLGRLKVLIKGFNDIARLEKFP